MRRADDKSDGTSDTEKILLLSLIPWCEWAEASTSINDIYRLAYRLLFPRSHLAYTTDHVHCTRFITYPPTPRQPSPSHRPLHPSPLSRATIASYYIARPPSASSLACDSHAVPKGT